MNAPGDDVLLAVEGLEAAYGQVQAVRGVSLSVGHSEVVAVIGANGAGKTTLLRALTGLLPSRGRIMLGGRPVARPSPEETVRLGISLVPERRQLFESMSVRDNLLLGAYHRIGQESRATIEEDLRQVCGPRRRADFDDVRRHARAVGWRRPGQRNGRRPDRTIAVAGRRCRSQSIQVPGGSGSISQSRWR